MGQKFPIVLELLQAHGLHLVVRVSLEGEDLVSLVGD